MDGQYGYYMTRRPPEPGTHPDSALFIISYCESTWHDPVHQEVWGWVCYAEPLAQEDMDALCMIPDEDNPVRYRRYGVVRRVIGRDADGNRAVVSADLVRDRAGKVFSSRYRRDAVILLYELKKRAEKRRDGCVEYGLAYIAPEKA